MSAPSRFHWLIIGVAVVVFGRLAGAEAPDQPRLQNGQSVRAAAPPLFTPPPIFTAAPADQPPPASELPPPPHQPEQPAPPITPNSNSNSAADAASALRPEILPPEALSTEHPLPAHGGFPALPPDPYAHQHDPLPPLEEELWHHGGSYMYHPEGDRLNWPADDEHAHYDLLRLPEDWQEPRPFTLFTDFLGADPIQVYPGLHWPGDGYDLEPQFVGYGGYQLFGFALEENNQRQDVLGHQLLVELDLRFTGTERMHVQFRPLGDGNTGGSYYQFSNPEGYVDNSTGEPARYWIEGELHSLLGGFVDPFAVLDYHITAGRFPLALHNSLLMNDEITGVVLNKNTIYVGPLSNLNVQLIYGANDVNTYPGPDGRLYGLHASIDYRRVFYEATYAFADQDAQSTRDAHYAALSRTQFVGPVTFAGRAFFKWGDTGGSGSGHLFVAETNYTRYFDGRPLGIEYGVFYLNAFAATEGWNSIGGGNFNRLRTSFETNPLVRIAAGQVSDTAGVALGVQLFRHHEDESFIPEIAWEDRGGEPVWGVGLRYLRKTGPRTFLEILGVANFADDPRFDREGVFVSHTFLF